MLGNLPEKIAEAKKGNQRAFSWLLDEFWAEVYAFQLKRVNDEAEAEDITVQTFARAFDKIGSFDEQYSFRTWLFTISKNIHIDSLRRQAEPILHLDSEEKESKRIADDTPTIEDSLIMEQQFDYLLKSIKQLKEPYRTAIQLRYLQEKSYKEIADEMKSTMNNVKITLLRAKKMLISKFNN
nr:sigma-70 family RNA polymerase sigma factor [uncultured Capnocytophaga sp.]